MNPSYRSLRAAAWLALFAVLLQVLAVTVSGQHMARLLGADSEQLLAEICRSKDSQAAVDIANPAPVNDSGTGQHVDSAAHCPFCASASQLPLLFVASTFLFKQVRTADIPKPAAEPSRLLGHTFPTSAPPRAPPIAA